MCRTTPLRLHETSDTGQNALRLRSDSLLARADHNGRGGDFGGLYCCKHVRQQRTSGDRMQDLGQGRAHPRAFAGREHDREASPSHQGLRGALIAEAVGR